MNRRIRFIFVCLLVTGLGAGGFFAAGCRTVTQGASGSAVDASPPDAQGRMASPSDGAGPESNASPVFESAVRSVLIPGTSVSFELVSVPAGRFVLGKRSSSGGAEASSAPAVEVSVDGFSITRFEILADAYSVFQHANRDSDSTAVAGRHIDVDAVARPSPPYEDPAHGMGGAGFPAVGMTQWGALQFARWLTEKTGEFFRLPTEAEWEYACKASSEGNREEVVDLGAVAWYEGNSDFRLHKPGQKRPNAWGAYDMLGNAAEWTLDQYDENFYAQLSDSDRHNPWRRPDRLHPRTVRGGAYDDPAAALDCASRQESSMNWKRRDPQIPKSFWWNTDSPFVGFRLVRPDVQPDPDEQQAFWQAVLGE